MNRNYQRPEETLAEDSSESGLTTSEQIEKIAWHFGKIMTTLGLDLNDSSLRETPMRVAKMYVHEAFMGLNPLNDPKITLFENQLRNDEIVLEKDIPFYSCCEHHFVPIVGKAHIAYIPKEQIIGLSKLNRITHYFSKRPQVQERLTSDIANHLKEVMKIEDVAVIVEAEHLCVASRGINHTGCTTTTTSFHGVFREAGKRQELLSLIAM